MPGDNSIKPIIPSQHLVIIEERPYFVLCKPKLLPLKSIAMLQVENIQREAEEKIKTMYNDDDNNNNNEDNEPKK